MRHGARRLRAFSGSCAGEVEQLLNSASLPPYSLSGLEKLDGRSFETQGQKKYEMRILAVVTYSGDALQCRIKLCRELHNYLVEIDKTTTGRLFFEQEGTGWR